MRRNADGVSHIWKEIVLPNLSVRSGKMELTSGTEFIELFVSLPRQQRFFFLQFNPFKLGFRWVVGEIEKRLAIPRAWRHPICDSVFKAGWLCLDALFFLLSDAPISIGSLLRRCYWIPSRNPAERVLSLEYVIQPPSSPPKRKEKKNICIFWIIHHIAPYRFPRSGFLVPSGHPCSNQDGEGLFQLQSPLYVFQFRIRYWASSLLPPSSFSISTMDSRLVSCLHSTRRIKAIGGMWPKEREKEKKKRKEEEKRLCAHVAICLESTEIGMTNGIQCVPEKRERKIYGGRMWKECAPSARVWNWRCWRHQSQPFTQSPMPLD